MTYFMIYRQTKCPTMGSYA